MKICVTQRLLQELNDNLHINYFKVISYKLESLIFALRDQ